MGNKEKRMELWMITIAALLTVVFGFFMIKSSITGFVVFEGESAYTDNILVNISSDMLYTWIPSQEGALVSLGISGYLEGDSAEVYLFDKLVYSSDVVNRSSVVVEEGSGEILLEFSYGDSFGYDNNNDGISYINDVIDFKVGAEFNFDKSLKIKKKDDISSKLCTKYNVNNLDYNLSQAVCYGDSECCSFLNLESSSSLWNNSFYLNYGKYGAGYNNSLFAQIIYYDVSLDEKDLHSYIYNSELKSLDANFVDRIYFDLTCVDSCSLPSYLNESYDLDISVDGLLHISDVVYTVVDDDTLVNITNETVINVTEVNVTFVNITNGTLINETLVNETIAPTRTTQQRSISGAGDSSNVPQTISLNGKLTDSSDDPLNGTYNMSFRIYDSPTGGSLLWEVVNQTITVDSNGIYHFTLVNVNLTFDNQTYLGIQVENDSEMIPRINLTSTPYTFRATTADSLNSLNNYQIQNLTLGEIINFSSGETIDNLVDGFIRVSGSLNVSGNITIPNGRVGIGTSSPVTELDVSGTITTDKINASEYLDKSLVLWMQFNNNQSVDSSIYGNNGTFEGGAHAEKDVAEFDGSDYLDLGKNNSEFGITSSDDITVSAWIKTDMNYSAPNGGYIITNYHWGWILGVSSSNKAMIWNMVDGTNRRATLSTDNINDGKWHHVLGILYGDGTQPDLYVDGLHDTGGTTDNVGNPTSLGTSNNNILIGRMASAADRYFNGSIDEVAIYNRALGSNEIQREYERGNKRYSYFNYIEAENISTTELCLTGDTCRSTWPSGADGTGGWTNTSTTTSTSLNVNITGSINLTGTIYFSSGAKVVSNSTCLVLYSPSGNNTIEVCD